MSTKEDKLYRAVWIGFAGFLIGSGAYVWRIFKISEYEYLLLFIAEEEGYNVQSYLGYMSLLKDNVTSSHYITHPINSSWRNKQ